LKIDIFAGKYLLITGSDQTIAPCKIEKTIKIDPQGVVTVRLENGGIISFPPDTWVFGYPFLGN